MPDEHPPYMYDQITDEEWRGFRILRAELDRIRGQRDRLRSEVRQLTENLDGEFGSSAHPSTDDDIIRRSAHLQTGDMTSE